MRATTWGVTPGGDPSGFQLHLDNFEGPFDVLLKLIGNRQMDVTEVALAAVTDEFLAYTRGLDRYDLAQVTEFLVIAATLLDLKAARLLPSADVEDEEDLALLEARDLLFARLLQYAAYKQAAAWLMNRLVDESTWLPRDVGLPAEWALAVAPIHLDLTADAFARLAARVLQPRAAPRVAVDHVHAPRVSVHQHMAVVTERLLSLGTASFRSLCADCTEPIEVVARFLACLELFREGHLAFSQMVPLGDLHVRWVAGAGSIGGGEAEDAPDAHLVGSGWQRPLTTSARTSSAKPDQRAREGGVL